MINGLKVLYLSFELLKDTIIFAAFGIITFIPRRILSYLTKLSIRHLNKIADTCSIRRYVNNLRRCDKIVAAFANIVDVWNDLEAKCDSKVDLLDHMVYVLYGIHIKQEES